MPPTSDNNVSAPSSRKVLVVGLVMALFNPPVTGIVYALFYAFKKETRRDALFVALWAIIWTVIYGFIFDFLLTNGHVSNWIIK